MAIHPDSNFPLLPRDQAEVIRLFIELMQDRAGGSREPQMLLDKRLGPRRVFGRSAVPGELQDID